MSTYRILIEKIDTVTEQKREYQKVADYGNHRDRDSYSFKSDNEEKHGGPQYDYVTFESTGQKTTKLLEQNTDELDISAVIKAINGL